MQYLITKLSVSLIAILIITAGLAVWIVNSTEDIPILQATPVIPQGWQKIEEQKFSLYLPPDMERCPEGGSVGDVGPGWEGTNFFCFRTGVKVTYTWYEHGKESQCEPYPIPENVLYQTVDTTAAGQRARLHLWNYPFEDKSSATALCFYDIGDGKTGLFLYVSNGDKGSLKVARGIFNSIEFRRSKGNLTTH